MDENSAQAVGERDRALVRQLDLNNIVVDDRVQARAETIAETVDAYAVAMREGDIFPPLVVFQENDTFILADGFTRYAAAKQVGLTDFACEVRVGGLRSAMLFAVGANATHGRPRSTADKHCAVLKLLNDDEWCSWVDREIARQCRVGHQLVAELRKRTGRATSERKFRTRHGGVAKMNTKRIGKTASPAPRDAAGGPTAADFNQGSPIPSDQNFDRDEALAMVAEFAEFVITRVDWREANITITVAEDDADQFRSLVNRAELAIRNEQSHKEI